jgi:serine/threonine protein phosphatase PrpC
MTNLHLGSDTNPGGRKYNEDRCAVDHFVTRSGLPLDVAVVCDGVGGEEFGERAAQLAVDTVLAHLRGSEETQVPRLLTSAVRAANAAVFAEAHRLERNQAMACTMVLALIVNGQTLHIANVGDSRIYLCRDGALQQLTRDHTFANVMVWMRKLTPQAAAANPDADKLMRALGQQASLQVDQGIYLDTVDYGQANSIGRAGIPLKTGDSVLLCSDGLMKVAPSSGQPLTTVEEIARSLQIYEGQAAARAVISAALGRIPVGDPMDNISVAVLQTEDPSRAASLLAQQAAQQRRQWTRMALVGLAVAVPLVALLVLSVGAFAGYFAITRRNSNTTATQVARITGQALIQTRTAAAWTATPTRPLPTPPPTLVPGEIAKIFSGPYLLSVLLDDNRLVQSPPSEPWFIAVNHRGLGANADVHLQAGTQLQLQGVTDARVHIRLLEGSLIFVQSGPYPNGAEIELAGLPVLTTVRGCLGAEYTDQAELTLLCFQGDCSLSTDFGVTSRGLAAGQSVIVDVSQLAASPASPITPPNAQPYWTLLQQTDAGQADAAQCDVPAPPSAPTPTMRSTREPGAAPPTNTPVPPTNTPVPPPSNTPVPDTQVPEDTQVPDTAEPG